MEMAKDYETCKGCPYYFGEIGLCMVNEDDVPDLPRNCKGDNK